MTIKDRIVNTFAAILPGTFLRPTFDVEEKSSSIVSGGTRKDKKKKGTDDFENLKKEVDIDDHKIALEELVQRYQTNIEEGLTTQQAREALEKNGPNALTPPPEVPEWVKFCKLLFGGFSALLWVRRWKIRN